MNEEPCVTEKKKAAAATPAYTNQAMATTDASPYMLPLVFTTLSVGNYSFGRYRVGLPTALGYFPSALHPEIVNPTLSLSLSLTYCYQRILSMDQSRHGNNWVSLSPDNWLASRPPNNRFPVPPFSIFQLGVQ